MFHRNSLLTRCSSFTDFACPNYKKFVWKFSGENAPLYQLDFSQAVFN